MNVRSLEKIQAAAQFIAQKPEVVQQSLAYLAEPIQLATSILKSLQDVNSDYKTAPEIAESLGISSETVRQVLRALAWNPSRGGIKMLVGYGNGKNAGYSLPQGKIIWLEPTHK